MESKELIPLFESVMTSKVTMDSREIAALVGKEHYHVIRDIESMLSELEQRGMDSGAASKTGCSFVSWYTGKDGTQRKCYKLPYRETMVLIGGYSIPFRAMIVDRWIALEKQHEEDKKTIERLQQFVEAASSLLTRGMAKDADGSYLAKEARKFLSSKEAVRLADTVNKIQFAKEAEEQKRKNKERDDRDSYLFYKYAISQMSDEQKAKDESLPSVLSFIEEYEKNHQD